MGLNLSKQNERLTKDFTLGDKTYKIEFDDECHSATVTIDHKMIFTIILSKLDYESEKKHITLIQTILENEDIIKEKKLTEKLIDDLRLLSKSTTRYEFITKTISGFILSKSEMYYTAHVGVLAKRVIDDMEKYKNQK